LRQNPYQSRNAHFRCGPTSPRHHGHHGCRASHHRACLAPGYCTRGRPPLAAPTFHLTARPRLCSAATWPCCLAVPGLRPAGLVIRECTLPVSTFMNGLVSLGDAGVTLSLIYSKMKGIDSGWSKQPRRTATVAPLRPRNRPSTLAKHPFALADGLQRQLARAQANMAAPFTGITTDRHVVPQH
jgi:hypothetical protein